MPGKILTNENTVMLPVLDVLCGVFCLFPGYLPVIPKISHQTFMRTIYPNEEPMVAGKIVDFRSFIIQNISNIVEIFYLSQTRGWFGWKT